MRRTTVLTAMFALLPLLGALVAQAVAEPVTSSAESWPLFRGDSLATGVAKSSLPDRLEVLWKMPIDKGAFEATAVISDGTVYVGDMDNTFYALRLSDGKEVWRFKAESGFNAAAAVRDGFVYVGDIDGRFYCLDAKDGKAKWGFKAEAEINGGPNFYKDSVLFGSQDATLYRLKADTGEVVWKHTIQDQIRCAPTIVENRCFLAGCDGKLHLIDLDKGESVGTVEIEAPTGSTPGVLGDVVYFGTEAGVFFGINWKTPAVQWKFRDPKRNFPYRSSAAVTSEAVFVGGRDKHLHALNPEDGKELWSFQTRGRIDSSPVLVGERLFFGAADGRLFALDRKSGKKVWDYEAGGSFSASPAVANNRLVIGNENGVLYCFGAKGAK